MKKLILISFTITGLFLGGCTSPTSTNTTNTTNTNTSATTPAPATPATPAETGTPAAPETPAGAAEKVTLEAVGIVYEVPAGWKKHPNGALESPDGTIGIALIEPEEKDVKKILEGLGGVLGSMLTDVKVEGEEASHEINGITSIYVNGTGKFKEGGKPVEWAVEVMSVKKSLVILEFFEPGAYEKNQAVFDAFEASFTALEGAEASESPAETPEATATESPEGE